MRVPPSLLDDDQNPSDDSVSPKKDKSPVKQASPQKDGAAGLPSKVC